MRRWIKIGAGVAGGVASLVGLFTLLTVLYGFQITDLTGDYACEGTYDNPCLFEFQVRNMNNYDVDIYSKDQAKLDFSPDIKDYALFVKDGRCGATGSCACVLENGQRVGFKGWRCTDFTNATKPRSDMVYNFRFARYSTYQFKLALIKPHPAYEIKWGFGVNSEYLDPIAESNVDRFSIKSINENLTVIFEMDNGFLYDRVIEDDTQIEYYFANDTGVNYVYGGLANTTELKNYTYISNSTLPRVYENEEWYILDGENKWKQHFDVCDKVYNVSGKKILPNCQFTEEKIYDTIETAFGNYTYQVNSILYVDFVSDRFIDPTLTQTNKIASGIFTSNVTAETNFTHSSTRTDIGLVGYWNFDMDNNATAWDFTTNNNDGTYTNGVYTINGLFGNGLDVRGIGNNGGERLTILDADSLTFSNGTKDKPFSFSVWVYMKKYDPSNVFTAVFGKNKNANPDREWTFGFDSNKYPGVYIYSAGASTNNIYALNQTSAPLNTWTNYIVTYDGSGSQNGINIYINGVNGTNSRTMTGTYTAMANTTANLVLGNFDTTSGYSMNGTLDDVVLYNKSLSQAEITAIYQNTSSRFKTNGIAYLPPVANVSLTGTGVNVTINITSGLINIYFNTNLSLRARTWNVLSGYNLSDSGLVAHWALDENAQDDKNGYDGVIFGNVSNTSGIYDGAYSFDGNDDFINMSDAGFPNGTSDRAIALWYRASKLPTNPNYYIMFAYGTASSSKGFAIIHDGRTANPNKIELTNYGDTFISNKAISDINWHHIVFSIEANGAGTRLYIDGIEDKFQATSGWYNTLRGGTARIGTYIDSTGDTNGTIDEVTLFNRSLTTDEVKQLYSRGLANWTYSEFKNISATNPRAFFNLVNNIGALALDVKHIGDANNFYTSIFGGDITYDLSYVVPPITDSEYPIFSNPTTTPPNNTAFVEGAVYQFNMTITSTNGTAGIEFNGTNYTLSNLTNVYNFTIINLSTGTYNYSFWAYGNGTSHLFNSSLIYSYTVGPISSVVCNFTDAILSIWAYTGGKWIDGYGTPDIPENPINNSWGEAIWNYEGEIGRLVDGIASSPEWTGDEIVGGCNVTDIAISMWKYDYRYITGFGSTTYNPSVNSTIGEAVWGKLNGRRLI